MISQNTHRHAQNSLFQSERRFANFHSRERLTRERNCSKSGSFTRSLFLTLSCCMEALPRHSCLQYQSGSRIARSKVRVCSVSVIEWKKHILFSDSSMLCICGLSAREVWNLLFLNEFCPTEKRRAFLPLLPRNRKRDFLVLFFLVPGKLYIIEDLILIVKSCISIKNCNFNLNMVKFLSYPP